jgi:hypothetical protein
VTTVLGGASAPVAVSGTRKWWALGALGLAGLAVGVDGTVLSVMVPMTSHSSPAPVKGHRISVTCPAAVFAAQCSAVVPSRRWVTRICQ